MTLLRRAVFPVALAVVLLAHVLVAVPSLIELRLWEDEAFNLTVPLNLLRGLGYTSDGTLSGSQLTPFDTRISTGPVVLLPVAAALATGADMVLAGRSVMLLFYGTLLAGLWVVGRRIGGRWAGLVAVVVPLALDTDARPSPLQGPADILGEIPAAAMVVLALATFRSRPWLAGLFLGLAVQCKAIALLALPALFLAVFFTEPGETLWQRVKRVLPMLGTALIPTAMVSLWQIIVLGPEGYRHRTHQFVDFLFSGGQSARTFSAGEKLTAFLSDWRLPLPATVVVILGALLIGFCAVILIRRGRALPIAGGQAALRRERLVLLAAAGVGLLTWLAWWLASSGTPAWVRHPSPGFFTFVPVLAAYVVLALRVLNGAPRLWARVVSVGGAVAFTAVLTLQVAAHVADARVGAGETLAEQSRAAVAIGALDEDWLAGAWGGTVSVTVMSGAHAALADAPAAARATRIWVEYDHSGRAELREWLGSHCGRELLATGPYVVCGAP
ncbi:hypothetical protein E3T54_05465 [Cryobacterium sp. Sr8]|uniref:hypothetical protein n=1 Tax=Cryobacterium sp. Sr8 TaxID=1259203 RepID=UPI00106A5518|nr:hypothetical protein [Cryobacterium sp. Sr8]TFD79126.1 hypothetical protein E3T54_05465 [Cryobacterium sp. Sr8]